MFERECEDLIKTSRALDYLKKISPSGRRDILVTRLEQYLLNDPLFINEVEVLKADIAKLESKVSLLEKQLVSARLMVPEVEYKMYTQPSFLSKLKYYILG